MTGQRKLLRSPDPERIENEENKWEQHLVEEQRFGRRKPRSDKNGPLRERSGTTSHIQTREFGGFHDHLTVYWS
jgi:hypothetical protein